MLSLLGITTNILHIAVLFPSSMRKNSVNRLVLAYTLLKVISLLAHFCCCFRNSDDGAVYGLRDQIRLAGDAPRPASRLHARMDRLPSGLQRRQRCAAFHHIVLGGRCGLRALLFRLHAQQ